LAKSLEEVVSTDETMILRTVYLPKHLDARFKLYASRSPSSKHGTLLRRLLVRSLKIALPLTDRGQDQGQLNETMVLRTVFLSKQLDNELKKIAFQRSQGKGELMRDLINGALDRVRERPVFLN
jgi:hypothetical protein